jgi:hypothetical protein
MDVRLSGPDMYLWARQGLIGDSTLCPADADGYPVVSPEPFSIWADYSQLADSRPGSNGSIISWDSILTFEGSAGEPQPVFLAVADASVPEGDRGTSTVAVPVTLSSASSLPVTVSYWTVDGTAKAKDDYTATSGKLTFKPGETRRTISVSINGDRKREANETFSVELAYPQGATFDDRFATVTIRNDD